MEVTISMHRRSKSEFCMRRNEENKLNKILPSNFLTLGMGNLKYCVEANNRQLASTDVQNSLKEEILQLQRQLKKQFAVRYELEKEMSYRPLLQLHDPANDSLTNKPAKDLIKEIATLELEIVNLEKYLLSLYRKTFGKKLSSRSQLDERSKSTHEWMFSEVPGQDKKAKIENSVEKSVKECSENFRAETLVDSSILRSHSSLSQNSAYSFRICPPMGTVSEAVNSYHSSPLSMLECTRNTASSISLAEHLGNSIPDYVRETPNWISEEMIKCISAIYCQIAEPPLFNHGFNSSPISFSSAMSESSPRGQNITRNPHCRENSSSNSWFSNPSFHINCSKEFSGSYFGMTEVQSICRDSHRLTRVESQLQNFRSLVTRLEEIDPRKLKREEKLAFWINVHNALVMHTFLVYGVPQRNLKRISLLLKAAYEIGGQTVSVEMMQSSILGCRLPRPGQWFQSLFFSKTRFKAGDARKSYAIERPEPLLQFALCSGSYSDPAVRLYTPKRVFQELEMAKEEYIQTTLRVYKEQKILLPKIVEYFAKELDLCPSGFTEMIQDSLPEFLAKSFNQHLKGNLSKKFDWISHNFSFRYLLSKELVE